MLAQTACDCVYSHSHPPRDSLPGSRGGDGGGCHPIVLTVLRPGPLSGNPGRTDRAGLKVTGIPMATGTLKAEEQGNGLILTLTTEFVREIRSFKAQDTKSPHPQGNGRKLSFRTAWSPVHQPSSVPGLL